MNTIFRGRGHSKKCALAAYYAILNCTTGDFRGVSHVLLTYCKQLIGITIALVE